MFIIATVILSSENCLCIEKSNFSYLDGITE